MTADQLSKTLTKHRLRSKMGSKMQEKSQLDGRNVKATHEDFLATNKAIVA